MKKGARQIEDSKILRDRVFTFTDLSRPKKACLNVRPSIRLYICAYISDLN